MSLPQLLVGNIPREAEGHWAGEMGDAFFNSVHRGAQTLTFDRPRRLSGDCASLFQPISVHYQSKKNVEPVKSEGLGSKNCLVYVESILYTYKQESDYCDTYH